MNNKLQISDLNGICTITYKGGDSLVRPGDLATHRPFASFADVDMSKVKFIPVSDKKLKGIERRQFSRMKSLNENNIVLKNTLLKRLNEDMFFAQSSTSTIQEVTNLKPYKWVKGKPIFPPFTPLQILLCFLADMAYTQFGTLRGVSVVVGLNSGHTIEHTY